MTNHNLSISIGGISVIIIADEDFISQIRDIYSNFLVPEKNPSISLTVETVPMEEFGTEFSDRENPDVTIDELSGLCTVRWQALYGEFDILKREGALKCTHPVSFSNFLRVIYTLILLEEPGFLIHASSLIKNGRGYLFPGKSGAGKTTITRLSPDATLLTDEVSLVKMVDSKFHIFGTPFWGELAIGGENVSVPLNAIYFPIKANENQINNLRPSQALQRFLPNVLFFIDSDDYRLKLFNLCHDLITTVPTKELHFLQEPSFWRLIDDE